MKNLYLIMSVFSKLRGGNPEFYSLVFLLQMKISVNTENPLLEPLKCIEGDFTWNEAID